MAPESSSNVDLFQHQIQNREVQDAVFGAIGSVRFPLNLVTDTAEFQRLRQIRQLGTAYLVYPTADHSRFEHSLGVCYLAGEEVRTLQKDSALTVTDVDVLCVELAGLCHDIGHGPFSHLFEQFVRQTQPEGDPLFKHETCSLKMLDYILAKYPAIKNTLTKEFHLTDVDFIFIKELILGSPLDAQDSPDKWNFVGRPEEKSFLYEIVSNKQNGFDVDKYDYFLRDSMNFRLGVDFDWTSAQRLIRQVKVRRCGPPGKERNHLCYPKKLYEDFVSVGNTRFRLHKLGYQHRTSKAFDLMVVDIFKLADPHLSFLGDDGERYRLSKCFENMGAYKRLDDSILSNTIQHSELEALGPAQQLLQRLLTRSQYRLAGSAQLPPEHRLDHDLEKQMLTPDLDPEDLVATVAHLDRGMGTTNPVGLVWFFDQKHPEKEPEQLLPDQVKNVPKECEQRVLMVFVKRLDRLEKGCRAFRDWCGRQSPPLFLDERC